MGAVAVGVIAMIGAAITFAVIIGGVGGIVVGRVKGNLILGTVIVGVVYVLSAYYLDLWLVVKAGFLPLIVTFLFSSVTVKYLEESKQVRPVLSVTTGLGITIVLYALCLLLARDGLFPFNYSVWVAAGIFICLAIYCVWMTRYSSR